MTASAFGVTVETGSARRRSSLMRFGSLASMAVRFVERIPAFVWAAWIVTVVGGTAVLALALGSVG